MARTTRTASSPLTQIKWQKELMTWALENNYFGQAGLIGTGANNLITLNKDLTQQSGKSVRCEIIRPLSGTGIGDNGDLMDNAEQITSHYMDVSVHERGHSVQIDGPMTQQYLNWDFPDKAVELLREWKGRAMEVDIVRALSGLYNVSTDIDVVNETAPSTNRIWFGGENSSGTQGNSSATYATDALLTAGTQASNLFGPSTLEAVMTLFLESEPRPQPLTIDGEEVYLCLIHPRQGLSWRLNSRVTAAHLGAGPRSYGDNVMWKRSYGVWSTGQAKVLVASYGRIEKRIGAGGTTPSEGFTLNSAQTATTDAVATGRKVCRALLLGRQAGVIAYGGQNGSIFNKRVEQKDGGRKPVYGLDWIYGLKKTQFSTEADATQEDYAVYCIDTEIY